LATVSNHVETSFKWRITMTTHTPIYNGNPWSNMSTTTLVPNGGYSIGTCSGNWHSITNTGAIYSASAITTGGINLQQVHPVTALTIGGQDGTLLDIRYDGRVEWKGPLSKNADAFVKAVEYAVDKNAAGEQAIAKSYRKAIERCLRQIKTMDKEQFISMLEQEVATRMSKAVWQELSKDTEPTDD